MSGQYDNVLCGHPCWFQISYCVSNLACAADNSASFLLWAMMHAKYFRYKRRLNVLHYCYIFRELTF